MDQAATLRKMMNACGENPSAAYRNSVLAVSSAEKGVGKNSFVMDLGRNLGEEGYRILAVDFDSMVFQGFAFSDFISDRISPLDSLTKAGENFWVLPMTEGCKEIGAYDESLKIRLQSVFESYAWNFDLVLINLPAGRRIGAFPTLVLTSGTPEGLEETAEWIRQIPVDAGVAGAGKMAIGIAINEVTRAYRKAEHARAAFLSLQGSVSEVSHVNLHYLGFLNPQKSQMGSMFRLSYLLNLKRGMSPLDLLATRLKGWCLDLDAVRSNVRSPIVHRFMEEPVGRSPRKYEGFWKTLFGEVNA